MGHPSGQPLLPLSFMEHLLMAYYKKKFCSELLKETPIQGFYSDHIVDTKIRTPFLK